LSLPPRYFIQQCCSVHFIDDNTPFEGAAVDRSEGALVGVVEGAVVGCVEGDVVGGELGLALGLTTVRVAVVLVAMP